MGRIIPYMENKSHVPNHQSVIDYQLISHYHMSLSLVTNQSIFIYIYIISNIIMENHHVFMAKSTIFPHFSPILRAFFSPPPAPCTDGCRRWCAAVAAPTPGADRRTSRSRRSWGTTLAVTFTENNGGFHGRMVNG